VTALDPDERFEGEWCLCVVVATLSVVVPDVVVSVAELVDVVV
jgi:hypothetical protein